MWVCSKQVLLSRAVLMGLAGNVLMDQCVGASCTPPKCYHKSRHHSLQRTPALTAEDG